MEPTFYIGGGNGALLIEQIFLGMGWKRTREKTEDNYRFKWCELKGSINYASFKEGEQIVNHIPNCHLLTNKLGLLNSLQEYERLCITVKKRPPKLDFIPETFRLDDPRDKELIKNIYKDGDIMICKPTGRNQGKGIYLIKTKEEFSKIFDEQDEKAAEGKPQRPLNRILQRYIMSPLLLNGKKFDIRCYMLIANTAPFIVLYHYGYVRLSINDYDVTSDSMITHLTNQFIQKKDPTYRDVKDQTTWTMEQLNAYVNDHVAPGKALEDNWVMKTLPIKIKQIMLYCFNAVKSKLSSRVGYTDLYGFDFMIDQDMKLWLIEVNVNPCLATNCDALNKVVPSVVKETIHICVECFEKARKGKPLLPLTTPTEFEVLYCGETKASISRSRTKLDIKRNTSPSRMVPTKTLSKEITLTFDTAPTAAPRSINPLRTSLKANLRPTPLVSTKTSVAGRSHAIKKPVTDDQLASVHEKGEDESTETENEKTAKNLADDDGEDLGVPIGKSMSTGTIASKIEIGKPLGQSVSTPSTLNQEDNFKYAKISRDGMIQKKLVVSKLLRANIAEAGPLPDSDNTPEGRSIDLIDAERQPGKDTRSGRALPRRGKSASKLGPSDVIMDMSEEGAQKRFEGDPKVLRTYKLVTADSKAGKSGGKSVVRASNDANMSSNNAHRSPYSEPAVALLRLMHLEPTSSKQSKREEYQSNRGS